MVTYWCVSECCSLIGSHRLYVYRNAEAVLRFGNYLLPDHFCEAVPDWLCDAQ